MNFQELLRQTPYEDIWDVLLKVYYEKPYEWQLEELEAEGISLEEWHRALAGAYERMIDELRTIVLNPSDASYLLCLYRAYRPFEENLHENCLDPFLILPGTKEQYTILGIPWDELASCEIYGKCLDAFGAAASAANILHMMTYHGYTAEQAEETTREIEREMEEALREVEGDLGCSMEEMYERGIIPRPTEEEKREREARIKAAAGCFEPYRQEVEAFFAETGWLGFRNRW